MSENYNRKKAAIRLTDRKEIYCQNHIFKSNFFCFSNGNSFFFSHFSNRGLFGVFNDMHQRRVRENVASARIAVPARVNIKFLIRASSRNQPFL